MKKAIIITLIIVVALVVDHHITKDAVEKCVAAGNNRDICIVELS